MKTRLLWLALCLTAFAAPAATPTRDEPSGIKFFTGNWKAVLAEAKRQKKAVFVDVFTTWCGPCKLMAKEAFPNATVGEKFNANFVSYQLDAEKGEGIALTKQYGVTGYPTALYLSAEGVLLHQAVGYGGIPVLLAEADKAIAAAKDPNPLLVMEKQFAAGQRDVAFLAAYLQKRANVGMPNAEALEAYLKLVPEAEWTSDKNAGLIGSNLTTSDSKAYDVLYDYAMKVRMTNREVYQKIITNGVRVANKNDYKRAIDRKDESQLPRLMANERKYLAALLLMPPSPEQLEEFVGQGYRMRFYKDLKDWPKYRTMALTEGAKLMAVPMDSVKAKDKATYARFQQETAAVPDSIKNKADFRQYAESRKTAETAQMAMKLNDLAWTYYENMTSPTDLEQALTWSARSLAYQRDAGYLDTYAHLLSKLGRKAEAIRTQEEAIASQKAIGQDTADLEKSLAEMKRK